jgi:uncharacterized protein (DUF2267 family)
MTETGISSIEHSIHLTNEWLKDLGEQLGWEDRQRAYRLLRAVLQALRDWLPVDEAANLGAQLPMLVRGIYYEGWHPAGTPVEARTKADFIARIDKTFETDPIDDVEEAVTAAFRVLNHHVSEGEVDDVREALPASVRELWSQFDIAGAPRPGL